MYNVLIVEDEYRIASFIDKGLRRHGFQTAIAGDGELAITMIEEQAFDLLILDLGLPIKDGWEVLKDLDNKKNNIPVVIVTAREKTSLSQKTLSYLAKPFKFQHLLDKIYEQLSPNKDNN